MSPNTSTSMTHRKNRSDREKHEENALFQAKTEASMRPCYECGTKTNLSCSICSTGMCQAHRVANQKKDYCLECKPRIVE